MKKLVLFDMDGTVYLGKNLIDGAKETFEYLRENNIDYVFLTNNSSHTIDFYVHKIKMMGIYCEEKNFYTATETTIKYLQNNNLKRIYVVGNESFKNRLKPYFEIIEYYDKNTKIDAVLASYDDEVTYLKLKEASLYIQDGVKFIATNMDRRCPIEDGLYLPDCGGICKCIEMCTNVAPKFLGKPEPEMINQVREIFNVSKKETMMVGDRYYTDIMAGINAEVDTFAVLTGESTEEEFKNADKKPTFIKHSIKDLKEILENEK